MTRHVIGSYALVATGDEKIRVLRQVLETAVFRLVSLGVDPRDVENLFLEALEVAEEENV